MSNKNMIERAAWTFAQAAVAVVVAAGADFVNVATWKAAAIAGGAAAFSAIKTAIQSKGV